MRKYFSFAFLLVCFIYKNSHAQDLIVTNVGDSIACKIVLQTEAYIHFSYNKYNHNTVRVITADRVKSTIPGFYTEQDSLNKVRSALATIAADSLASIALKTADKVIIIDKNADSVKTELPRWSFGMNGGYAYRLFRPMLKSTPYELKYLNELKSGYSAGADVFYFPWKKVGFGMKYDIYKSKGERDIRTKDHITIQFMGLSVANRMLFQNKKMSLVTAFWIGYQPYRNVTRFISQDYTLKANTMGWGVSAGLDHKISKKVALTFAASCFLGSVYKFKKEMQHGTEMVHLSKDTFEDLSRAEFTIGLKLLK